jgi:MOSC domain-containing protein YiiM
VAVEEIEEVVRELGIPQIKPEWLGANLLISGIPCLTYVPPASRFHFKNGVVIVIQGENEPCSNVGKIIQEKYPQIANLSPSFVKAAMHKRGVVAWVEKPGKIEAGEKFEAEIAERIDYTQFIK